MTDTNVTPSEESNEHTAPKDIVDNEGNEIKKEPTQGGQTIESLEKALKDTKAELTKLQQGAPKDEEESEEVVEDKKETTEIDIAETEKEAVKAGVDFEALSTEYNSKGELSEASYKDLEAKGFPKQVVDDYIAGQKARNDIQTQALSEIVGGPDNLPKVLEWAAENLTPEEITAYNEAANGSAAQRKLALQGVYARYSDAEGVAPKLVTGSVTNNSSNDVFKSAHAMTKAMEDPRYWSDPDYRDDVSAKVERSFKAGTI